MLETARRRMEFVGCRGLHRNFDNVFSEGSTSGCSPRPASHFWIVVIYEREQNFNDQVANEMASNLVMGCEAVGMVTQTELDICPPTTIFDSRDAYQPSANAYQMGVRTRCYRSGLLSYF